MDDTPEPPSKYVLIAERARKVEEDRSVAREKYDLLRNCDRDELEEINAQVKALHDQIKTLLERGQQIQENDSALVAKRDQELAIIESQGDIDINSLCEGGTASLTAPDIVVPLRRNSLVLPSHEAASDPYYNDRPALSGSSNRFQLPSPKSRLENWPTLEDDEPQQPQESPPYGEADGEAEPMGIFSDDEIGYIYDDENMDAMGDESGSEYRDSTDDGRYAHSGSETQTEDDPPVRPVVPGSHQRGDLSRNDPDLDSCDARTIASRALDQSLHSSPGTQESRKRNHPTDGEPTDASIPCTEGRSSAGESPSKKLCIRENALDQVYQNTRGHLRELEQRRKSRVEQPAASHVQSTSAQTVRSEGSITYHAAPLGGDDDEDEDETSAPHEGHQDMSKDADALTWPTVPRQGDSVADNIIISTDSSANSSPTPSSALSNRETDTSQQQTAWEYIWALYPMIQDFYPAGREPSSYGVKKLMKLTQVNDLTYNTARGGAGGAPPAFSLGADPRYKPSLAFTNLKAALVQATGQVSPIGHACSKCVDLNGHVGGIWVGCVRAPAQYPLAIPDGCCANCYYMNHSSNCKAPAPPAYTMPNPAGSQPQPRGPTCPKAPKSTKTKKMSPEEYKRKNSKRPKPADTRAEPSVHGFAQDDIAPRPVTWAFPPQQPPRYDRWGLLVVSPEDLDN